MKGILIASAILSIAVTVGACRRHMDAVPMKLGDAAVISQTGTFL